MTNYTFFLILEGLSWLLLLLPRASLTVNILCEGFILLILDTVETVSRETDRAAEQKDS